MLREFFRLRLRGELSGLNLKQVVATSVLRTANRHKYASVETYPTASRPYTSLLVLAKAGVGVFGSPAFNEL